MGYTLLVTLAVSVTLGSAYLLTESLITDEVDLIIDTELQSLEEKFARSGVPGVTDEINLRIDSWGRIGAVYMLADANFERIAGNVTDWPFDGMPRERWPEFEIGTIEPGRRAVHPVRAAVRTLPGGDLLLVGTDISQGRRFADKFRFATLWGIGLSTLAAALAGFWFSYRLARRVGQVADTCQRIMAGEAGRRLPVAGTRDEFDSLAVSVNRVLDRLEEQARHVARDLRQRRARPACAAAPAAHAHGCAAHAYPAARAGGLRVGRRSAARGRAPATHARDAVADRARRVRGAARVRRRRWTWRSWPRNSPNCSSRSRQPRGWSSCARPQGPALVQGNRQLLAQLLTNLIENGLKYVPPRGRIELSVRPVSGAVRLSVSDNGPGIAAEDRARAGQPFVRFGADTAQHGSGLGLSLVAAIVRLHRGRLELQENNPGLRVLIDLPA